jgi:hypothetical protein
MSLCLVGWRGSAAENGHDLVLYRFSCHKRLRVVNIDVELSAWST